MNINSRFPNFYEETYRQAEDLKRKAEEDQVRVTQQSKEIREEVDNDTRQQIEENSQFQQEFEKKRELDCLNLQNRQKETKATMDSLKQETEDYLLHSKRQQESLKARTNLLHQETQALAKERETNSGNSNTHSAVPISQKGEVPSYNYYDSNSATRGATGGPRNQQQYPSATRGATGGSKKAQSSEDSCIIQ